MQWILRPATEADLPFLLQLRMATMVPQFAREGLVLSDEEHRLRAAFRLDAARIVQVDGQDAGMIKLLRDADGTWTVEQFQVAPAHQGSGLGGAVLQGVIDEARAAGATLRLSVLKHNPARHLYRRLGFKTTGESARSFKMTWMADALPPGPER